MAHFKRVTLAKAGDGMRNAVIMGSRTWASIPEKFRPLEGRLNVVLTRKAKDPAFCSPYPDGVMVASSVSAALELLGATSDVAEIFVIGGQQAYQEAVEMASCERIFVTRVGKDMDCDAFFPAFDEAHYKLVHVSKTRSREGLPYDFVVYERMEEDLEQRIKRMRLVPSAQAGLKVAPLPAALSAATGGSGGQSLHDEYQYLSAIREIIEKGVPSGDRTGTGTRSIF